MPNSTSGTNANLSVDYFTEDERLKACLQQLHTKFRSPGSEPFVVSDILDQDGNQYVDLVQKGGGVLGIALVGYTYILEQMGVRFLRLAGTSAGAINTALMAVIGEKQEPKSVKVLDYMCKLKFFSLVDGHPAARWLIKNFITNKDFSGKVEKWLRGILVVLGLLVVCDFLFLGLQTSFPYLSWVTLLFFMLTGFMLLSIVILVTYVSVLLKRLKESGLGINPGEFFYNWIKDCLTENGVSTVSELKAKAEARVPGLHLRNGVDHPKGLEGLAGDVTFIASELVSQNKIQFPKMCNFFRQEKDIDQLHPAGFIRASMSIPVFFESYYIKDIPCSTKEIKDIWVKEFNEVDPPHTVRFVDGGILSNFPVDLFYDPTVSVPRMPVFGINLDDTQASNNEKHAMTWTFLGYFARLFNTVRYYYDKEFLLKNKMFQRGIGKVPLSPAQFNWLNFFLKPEQMKELFIAGAQAATYFLIGNNEKGNEIEQFNWEAYKEDRSKNHQELLNERKNPAK